MAQVLIIEKDEDIRASLHAVLEFADHRVVQASSVSGGLDILAASRAPLVALCSNARPTHTQVTRFFAQVAANAALAQRHGYICLTTNPDQLPLTLSSLLAELAVPILGKPFDIQTLLATVDEVAASIAPSSMTTRPNRSA